MINYSGQYAQTIPAENPSLVPSSPRIVVAVLDTGIDNSHEDLQNVISQTQYDFVNNVNVAVDDNFHGTHVSGIIGAVTNNTKGIAGIAEVTIMPIKVLGSDGAGSVSQVIAGIYFAQQNGAQIINMSLGFTTTEDSSSSVTIEKNAISNFPGLVVVAAGNDGVNLDTAKQKTYPAAYNLPNMITVGACNISTNPVVASFSNYGQNTVHLFAPGVLIVSTAPMTPTAFEQNQNPALSGNYLFASGTSAAAPHVTAAAALLLAQNPSLTGAQLKQQILKLSTPASGLNQSATGGYLDLAKIIYLN
jgi:serine protease